MALVLVMAAVLYLITRNVFISLALAYPVLWLTLFLMITWGLSK